MTPIYKIFIISAVYPPEPQVSARMSFDLASYFAELGFDITVLCPKPSRPHNADYCQNSTSSKPAIAIENNVKVVRLPSFTSPESKLLPRMSESFSFGREVTKYLANEKIIPDVLYVNSWPMLAQAFIANFAKKNRIPMVLQIMDIYPESLTIKLSAFISTIIHPPLHSLDAWITKTATTVVVISDNMRRIYTENRHISANNVVTIPTWQDETVFNNIPLRTECCARYGLSPYRFTFLYLGNIGPVAGVDFLIRAFSIANLPDAQLLIVGDGTSKSDCVALSNQLNLTKVHFISDSDAANVPILQGMAHVCMLPMKHGAGMSSIPSKLPSYLFSAKPVIATVDLDSDTAAFVRQAECGWIGKAEDLGWLANKMKEVSQLPLEQLEAIGRQGKEFGLTHFSKSTGVVRLADTIIKAIGVNV